MWGFPDVSLDGFALRSLRPFVTVQMLSRQNTVRDLDGRVRCKCGWEHEELKDNTGKS